MATEERGGKSTRELLAAIRPADEPEDDIEEEEDAPAEESPVETSEDEPAGDDPPKVEAKKANAEKSPADHYFERQRRKTNRELEEERSRRLQLESRMEEMQRRLDAVTAPRTEEKKPAGNPFDKNDQPIEFLDWERATAKAELEELRAEMAKGKEKNQEVERQAQQEQAVAAYAEKVDAELKVAFAEVQPFAPMFHAYNEALVQHYVGQGMEQKAAVRQATLDHLRVAHVGEQQGLSTAEAIYVQATRLGFKPEFFQPAATPAPVKEVGQQPNLDGARRASRRAPRSINAAPGGAGNRAKSVEALQAKRDKEWTKNDSKAIFSMLREKAGAF